MAQVTTGSPHFIETQSVNNLANRATGLVVPTAPPGFQNIVNFVEFVGAKAYGVGLPPGEVMQRAYVTIGGTTPTSLTSAPVSTTPYPTTGTYTEVAVSRDLPSTLAQGAVLTTALTTPVTPGADANYSGLMTVRFSGWVGLAVAGSVNVVHVAELGGAWLAACSSPSESFTLYGCTVDYTVTAGGGGGGPTAVPTVSHTLAPGSGSTSTTFTVTDTSTQFPTSVSTNWGDGTPVSAGSPVSHTYAAAGTHTITHNAGNSFGAGTPSTSSVTVTSVGVAGTLRQAAITRGKRAGTSVQAALLTDSAYAAALATNFNSVTAENEMKIDWLWGFGATRSAGNFAAADQIVAYANANGMNIRGHTLAWGQAWFSQLIGWLNNTASPAAFATLIQTTINDTLAHFSGNVRRWDCVNEVYAYANTGLYDANVFTQNMGANWVEQIFQWAHAADPSAELWWNETNMEQNTLNLTAWRAKVRQMVTAGVPIHGVGFQAHLFFGNPDMGPIVAAIQDFRSLGLKVAITEMDVPVGTYQWWPLTRTATDQANIYRDFANAVFGNGGDELTVWGVANQWSWYETPYGPVNGWPSPRLPLLLTSGYAQNQAYTAVLGVLNALPPLGGGGVAPVASGTVTPLTGNAPHTILATSTSTGFPNTLDWNWGDGTSHGTTAIASHTYATSGARTVTLTATNTFGSTTATFAVTVTTASAAPVASFDLLTAPTLFAPAVVTGSNTSSNGPTTTEWRWGDGTTSAGYDASHVYAVPGFYRIELFVSNAVGSSTASRVVQIGDLNPRPEIVAPTGGRSITIYGVDGSVWDACDGPLTVGADPQLWGMPPVGIAERASFGVPGSTVTSRRHQARDLIIPITVAPELTADIEGLVARFARAIDPVTGDVIIRVTRADMTAREIVATYLAGWDQLRLDDDDWPVLNGVIVLRAGDPYWQSTIDEGFAVNPDPASFAAANGTAFNAPGVAFNASIPFNGVGGSGIAIFDAVNTGDVAAWPTFEAGGPATLIEASNLTTGESWQFTGGMLSGDHLSIVTRPGTSEVHFNGANAYGRLSDSSTLWSLPPGTSEVALRFSESTGNQSSFFMAWTPRYLTC